MIADAPAALVAFPKDVVGHAELFVGGVSWDMVAGRVGGRDDGLQSTVVLQGGKGSQQSRLFGWWLINGDVNGGGGSRRSRGRGS
jgi:hypothetical protein